MSEPACVHCGGLHFGSPRGKCVFICPDCGKDIRRDVCECPPKEQVPVVSKKPNDLQENVASAFKLCNEQSERIAALTAERDTANAELERKTAIWAADEARWKLLEAKWTAENAALRATIERLIARPKWVCFSCDFATSDEKEAAAHFGDRDDPEECKPLCKWWQLMDANERIAAFQDLAAQLVEAREVELAPAPPQDSLAEIDELCCEWGAPEYRQTDDGEAWYWCFAGHDLPVADNLSELFYAARRLAPPTPQATKDGE